MLLLADVPGPDESPPPPPLPAPLEAGGGGAGPPTTDDVEDAATGDTGDADDNCCRAAAPNCDMAGKNPEIQQNKTGPEVRLSLVVRWMRRSRFGESDEPNWPFVGLTRFTVGEHAKRIPELGIGVGFGAAGRHFKGVLAWSMERWNSAEQEGGEGLKGGTEALEAHRCCRG